MKRIILAALAVFLAGCAGLNVSWTASASYNSDMVVKAGATHVTSPFDAVGEPRKK